MRSARTSPRATMPRVPASPRIRPYVMPPKVEVGGDSRVPVESRGDGRVSDLTAIGWDDGKRGGLGAADRACLEHVADGEQQAAEGAARFVGLALVLDHVDLHPGRGGT